jgi:hypothetical protein
MRITYKTIKEKCSDIKRQSLFVNRREYPLVVCYEVGWNCGRWEHTDCCISKEKNETCLKTERGYCRYPRFFIFAVLLPYHEGDQYPTRGHGRSCRAGLLSCVRHSTGSSYRFDCVDCEVSAHEMYHSENPQACYTSCFTLFRVFTGFYAFLRFMFSICAAYRSNAAPAYKEGHLCLESARYQQVTWNRELLHICRGGSY